MTITPTTLTRAAGVAAVAAGLIFIGVQINHPHSDVDLRHHDRVGRPQLAEGADGRPGPGRHHRHVPAPGEADRRAGPRRVPGLRRRLPHHHVHRLRRRLRPALHRRDRPRLRQRRPRRGHQRQRHRRHRPDADRAPGPASPTWPAASSSASRCTGHASSPAGRPRSSPSAASSPSRSPCCRTPSTGSWPSRTASP